MADQQIPPEVLAQLAQNGGAAAPDSMQVTAAACIEALLTAIEASARKSAMAGDSAAEAKDFAAAALQLAQALITMDPTRLQGGDTPEARKAATPDRPATSDADRDGRIGE